MGAARLGHRIGATGVVARPSAGWRFRDGPLGPYNLARGAGQLHFDDPSADCSVPPRRNRASGHYRGLHSLARTVCRDRPSSACLHCWRGGGDGSNVTDRDI